MMFDAAAAMVVREAVTEASGHDAAMVPVDTDAAHAAGASAEHASEPASHDAAAIDQHPAEATQTTGHDRREAIVDTADTAVASHDVIFLDTSVDDYRQLAAEWAGRGDVVLIDGTRDGLAQMQSALAGRHDVGAIHIVSHGSEGVFWLGTTRVDEASIAGGLAGALAAIGETLQPGGDILIYGCNFGEGADGARALEAFAGATHADVAASTDTTGYAGRGADWTLEAHRGAIETRALDSVDWVHTLDPNTPVPISVGADSLTVTDGTGTVVVTGTTGYGTDARSPDVSVGAVAVWQGAATYQGQSVDLRATVVSLSAGDAIRFNRPTGTGANGDDPTFLLRDLTAANDATVQIRWELVLTATGAALPADVRFTISDIDGIGGNPNTRESVTAATTDLAYYTRERVSDINFTSSLAAITASGTQNENTVAGAPITSASAATFDWSAVSSFTLTYKLTTNAVATQAQFYHDGDADFIYTDPVYVSIPRLDLDRDDGTAPGNDAHFTFVEDGAAVPIVDSDVVVSNPMDIQSVTGATVRLTNYKTGDTFAVGTLPAGISASIGAVTGGAVTVTLSGTGSETDYAAALRAITFRNTSDAPDTTQRVIEVTFSNDTLTSATAISRIDVVPVNDAPNTVGTLPARATSDAATVTYATSGGFSDADGDALSYTATGLPAGLTIDAATGVISGTLGRSASQVGGGTYTVVVTARDPSGATATQSFGIAVANPGPVAVNDSATTNEDTVVIVPVLSNDSDPDGDPLTVTAASALHGSVVRNADGTLSYTPNADYNGDDTISYTISDGQGGVANATVAVTVDPVNDAPDRVGTLPARSTSDAATVSYPTAAAFTDRDGDTLSYTASGLPAGLAIDAATGVISGTVGRSASQVGGGNYTVVVTARDRSGATATQSFAIAVVNPTPTATNDSATTPEDTPVTIAVLGNDSDPDGDPLMVTAASALHGTIVRNADGTLTYTPDLNYNGSDTISYTISDGQGGTASATVAVTIAPVNDAPTRIGTLPSRSEVDAGAVSFGTAGGFADPEGDALTYSATGLPAGLSIDAATGVVSGTIDRSASQSGGGNYAVVVTARDPSGASTTQSFAYTVANPPPVAVNDGATTDEDTPVTIAVLGNDSDPDGDPLSVVAASALHGSVVRNADGTLTYTPNADYNGSDTISYTISDGQGGTANATVAITVTPVNDAPRAVEPPPSYSAADGSTVSLSIANAFSDPDGDALTYSATGLPAGLSLDPATGVISGTLDRSASQTGGGVYTIQLTARDPSGTTATQTVTLTATNPPPTAGDDSATTSEDQPVTIAVLTNDSDPDGDPLSVVAASALHGSALVNPDGSITYMPAPDFNGTDTITYTIDDGNGGRSTATVTVTVAPVNDAPTTTGLPPRSTADGSSVATSVAPAFGDADGDALQYAAIGLPPGLSIDPATGVIGGTIAPGSAYRGTDGSGTFHVVVTATDPTGASVSTTFDWSVTQAAPAARDDSATTPEDTPVTIPVLANDADGDADPLVIVAASATHGTAYVVGGDIVFYPAPDYTGLATVTYTIADPAGNRSTATVTIDVTPVNDAPVATPLPPTQSSDAQPIVLDVGGFFRDPESDALTFSAIGLPSGLSIDSATGRIAGTIDRSASQVPGGLYRVTVTATDSSGAATGSSFDWTIVNPAPIARDDAATTSEETSVVIAVLPNDSDLDGDPLRVVSVDAGHGRVTIGIDGRLNYTPDADFNGNDVIVYTIDDGDGGRATASVLVTVSPVNDAPVAVQPHPTEVATTDSAPLAIDTAAWFRDVDGDALGYAATGLPPGLTIDPATGAIRGTLDRSASRAAGGLYHVVVTARDPSGAGTAATFDIRVANPAPVARDDAATALQDGPGITIPVLDNDRDPDGDPLSVVAVAADHGSVSINADGTVRYVPGASFSGSDTIRYAISDREGGTASATVAITVVPVERLPVAGGVGPVDAIGGRPVVISVLPGASDPDGDPLIVTAATTAVGTVRVNPDSTVTFTPSLGFVGTTTVSYTVSDGRGGTATGTVTVRVADGRGADIEQLLRIGRVTFRDPTPALATVTVSDGTIRNPLSLIETVEEIRSLRSTAIGEQPVGDAVEAIATLRGIAIDPDMPILAEVARLDALRDQRDAGDRLFDQRWSDFMVKGLSGFSAAADNSAGVIVDAVVHGGAIYLEVRDTADGRTPIRTVDVRLASGDRTPDWIKVDPRGMAIIERAADMDELHLVVRVTRSDGHTSSTPIVVQGATGEVELDRHVSRHGQASPLDVALRTPKLQPPSAAIQSEATRLASYFQ